MTASPSLMNRIGLVTGGASGIGLGIATALLTRGARVVIGDVRTDHMERAGRALAAFKERVYIRHLDVTDADAWVGVREEVRARFGTVHLLCLNAGIGVLGTILQARPHDWDWLMGVNLRGVTLGLETFLPLMRDCRQGGHICATSSMGGLVVADDGGIYSSAKFGVVALMECLRMELACEGIGVTVLCPAGVNTNIHDHGSMRPREFGDSGIALDPERQREMAAMARSILALGADPMLVGERVVDAILANESSVFTDAAVAPILRARRDALIAAARASAQHELNGA